MPTLCSTGFLGSNAHLKIIAHWLLGTGKEWAEQALDGMISKAQSTIMKDYMMEYMNSQTGNISTDPAVLLPAILAMPSFHAYNIPTPTAPSIDCDRPKDQQLWPDGFTIEQWEMDVLNAYYASAEDNLKYLMFNKIFNRGMAMVKDIQQAWIGDPNHTTMPACMADLIDAYTDEEGYLNRAQREAQQ